MVTFHFTGFFCRSPHADLGKINQEPNQDTPNKKVGLLSRGLGWLEKSKVRRKMCSALGYNSLCIYTEGPTSLCNPWRKGEEKVRAIYSHSILKS